MRWRGVHHCARCGQPTVRERLSDAARSLLRYTHQAEDAPGGPERLRWIAAAERMDQALRDELERLARDRAALLAPLKRFQTADPTEWKHTPVDAAPPPPEFHALAEALRSRRRLGPEPAPAEPHDCGELPQPLRALAERARAW